MFKLIINLMRFSASILIAIGVDPRRFRNISKIPRFMHEAWSWSRMGGGVDRYSAILSDYDDLSGVAKGHYFHQDLLVANKIFERCPDRHIDVASRVDGFVAHVASFRKIDVLDIRPLNANGHVNINFIQADLTKEVNVGQADSVSCLHAIEHFGLGRYSDELDPDGHIKGLYNLIALLSVGGMLYLSVPVGLKTQVHFNAQRVFHPVEFLQISPLKEYLQLICFDFVDDEGVLFKDINISKFEIRSSYGLGIYTFQRVLP